MPKKTSKNKTTEKYWKIPFFKNCLIVRKGQAKKFQKMLRLKKESFEDDQEFRKALLNGFEIIESDWAFSGIDTQDLSFILGVKSSNVDFHIVDKEDKDNPFSPNFKGFSLEWLNSKPHLP